MGLFNSGKNEKVEKVSKYERHYNVPENSSRRRSSKHRPHPQGESAARALSQPPLLRHGPFGVGGGVTAFPPIVVNGFNPAVMNPVRYPMGGYDISKYVTPANPYGGNFFPGVSPMGNGLSGPGVWNKGIPYANNRSIYPGFTDAQQRGWPFPPPPSNYQFNPQQF